MASMRVFHQLVILLLFGGCNGDFIFSNPPNTATGGQHYLPGWAIDNPIYQIGTTLNVTWTTDWTAYTIYLSQLIVEGISGYEGSTANIVEFTKNSSTAETGGFDFNVEIGSFSLTTSNIFFFTATDAASADAVSFGIFNVTENAVTTSASTATTSSSTSTTSGATSTTSTATSATTTSATTPAAESTPTDASRSSSSSNTSLELGLGIGLGAGLLLVALVAAALIFKIFHNKKKNEVPREDQYYPLKPPYPSTSPSISVPSKPTFPDTAALGSYNGELPATPVAARTLGFRNYELQG